MAFNAEHIVFDGGSRVTVGGFGGDREFAQDLIDRSTTLNHVAALEQQRSSNPRGRSI